MTDRCRMTLMREEVPSTIPAGTKIYQGRANENFEVASKDTLANIPALSGSLPPTTFTRATSFAVYGPLNKVFTMVSGVNLYIYSTILEDWGSKTLLDAPFSAHPDHEMILDFSPTEFLVLGVFYGGQVRYGRYNKVTGARTEYDVELFGLSAYGRETIASHFVSPEGNHYLCGGNYHKPIGFNPTTMAVVNDFADPYIFTTEWETWRWPVQHSGHVDAASNKVYLFDGGDIDDGSFYRFTLDWTTKTVEAVDTYVAATVFAAVPGTVGSPEDFTSDGTSAFMGSRTGSGQCVNLIQFNPVTMAVEGYSGLGQHNYDYNQILLSWE